MSASTALVEGFHHPGESALHRLPPHTKILSSMVFVFAMVATPREAIGVFVVDAAVVAVVIALLRLPAVVVLRRLRLEIPFVAFALLLPFIGDGWWAAWNVLVKATLGVLAAIALSASTPPTELLSGLERLRVPRIIVATAGFMVRYLEVIVGEVSRMRIARLSRADDPRFLWQVRGIASTAGTMFVRSYERGERVHLAMLSRGYSGAMPVLHTHHATRGEAIRAALPPVIALAGLVAGRAIV